MPKYCKSPVAVQHTTVRQHNTWLQLLASKNVSTQQIKRILILRVISDFAFEHFKDFVFPLFIAWINLDSWILFLQFNHSVRITTVFDVEVKVLNRYAVHRQLFTFAVKPYK